MSNVPRCAPVPPRSIPAHHAHVQCPRPYPDRSPLLWLCRYPARSTPGPGTTPIVKPCRRLVNSTERSRPPQYSFPFMTADRSRIFQFIAVVNQLVWPAATVIIQVVDRRPICPRVRDEYVTTAGAPPQFVGSTAEGAIHLAESRTLCTAHFTCNGFRLLHQGSPLDVDYLMYKPPDNARYRFLTYRVLGRIYIRRPSHAKHLRITLD